MENYIGRENDLKNRLNTHLQKLTGNKQDFYSNLSQSDLIELKTVLADINNVLTLKTTIHATYWLCKYFHLTDECKKGILSNIDSNKPNANGFDIHIQCPKKIIAEVKCIVPINNGDIFGAAQRDAILDDAIKLKNGKGKLSDTSDYFKFLFLIDLDSNTDRAISKLLQKSKGTSNLSSRANRHKIKEHIELLDDSIAYNALTIDKIYIKKMKIDF